MAKTNVSGSKIPFTQENISKCICPGCPVQLKSECSRKKMVLKNPTRPEDIPKLYCSSGIAACKDLDAKQMCICGSCPVFEEFKLANGYFCVSGKAT